MNKQTRTKTGHAKLEKGEMPKPNRITATLKPVHQLYSQFESVPSIARAIVTKDTRTVRNYDKALAQLKLAYVEIEDMMVTLDAVLNMPTKMSNEKRREYLTKKGQIKLPPIEEVVRLFNEEGCTAREIALRFDTALSTVYRAIARGEYFINHRDGKLHKLEAE